MMESCYSIHDIVRFKIVNNIGLLNKFYFRMINEYQNFRVNKINEPDFTIYLGKFNPRLENSYILDDKYYIKENYLYCKDRYKFGHWEIEIGGLEKGGITVNIFSNYNGIILIPGFIIDPLICFKMNEKGYSIVHASCISKNGHAFLFPASSGAGKTTTALYFVEKGFDFLGDNFVILNDGNVLNFLSPLSIFTYNLAPVIEKNLGTKNKIILDLKHLLYMATSGYIKIFTKINPKDAFSNLIVNKSKLNSVVLLFQKQEFCIERINKDKLINHLILNLKSEFFLIDKYMLEYSYMFPESNPSTYWNRCKDNLRKNLEEKDLTFYKVEVPQNYDAEIFKQIFKVISK